MGLPCKFHSLVTSFRPCLPPSIDFLLFVGPTLQYLRICQSTSTLRYLSVRFPPPLLSNDATLWGVRGIPSLYTFHDFIAHLIYCFGWVHCLLVIYTMEMYMSGSWYVIWWDGWVDEGTGRMIDILFLKLWVCFISLLWLKSRIHNHLQ